MESGLSIEEAQLGPGGLHVAHTLRTSPACRPPANPLGLVWPPRSTDTTSITSPYSPADQLPERNHPGCAVCRPYANPPSPSQACVLIGRRAGGGREAHSLFVE